MPRKPSGKMTSVQKAKPFKLAAKVEEFSNNLGNVQDDETRALIDVAVDGLVRAKNRVKGDE
jgi:hypothetical protein